MFCINLHSQFIHANGLVDLYIWDSQELEIGLSPFYWRNHRARPCKTVMIYKILYQFSFQKEILYQFFYTFVAAAKWCGDCVFENLKPPFIRMCQPAVAFTELTNSRRCWQCTSHNTVLKWWYYTWVVMTYDFYFWLWSAPSILLKLIGQYVNQFASW